MHILFVLENYHPHVGGVETLFRGVAEGLAALGHTVTVVTHRLPGTRKQETVGGVHIIRVSCFNSRYWFTFLSLPSVFRFAWHAHIIHTTTYNGAPPAWLAACVLRKPAVITVHEVLGKRWAMLGTGTFFSSAHQLFECFILALGFDQYIAVSQSTARQLSLRGYQNNVSVVYNGLDYSFWHPMPHEKKVFRKKLGLGRSFAGLFFGRPGISKGLEIIIRALPLIKEQIDSFHLVIVMSKDKAYERRGQQMRELVGALHVENMVTFLPSVSPDMLRGTIAAVDCAIVPSLSEGFGLAAVEVCAVGTPLIASDVDSIPEVVSGKWLLFESGNSHALAEQIVATYHKHYHKNPLKQFPLQETIKNYLKTYQNFVHNETSTH